MMRQVERIIESCEHSNPELARTPFVRILDGVTDSDPCVTDYLLEEPAKCPRCRQAILENTLVRAGQAYAGCF